MTISKAYQAYLDAKVEQSVLLMEIKTTPDTSLLAELNSKLETASNKLDEAFAKWCVEVDEITKPIITPSVQPVVTGWFHEDYLNSTPGAA